MSADTRNQDARAPSAKSAENRWPEALVFLGAIMLLQIALMWEASSTMVETWYRSATFNHGFLVPIIVGYLIWQRRHELVTVPPRPSLAGIVLLAAGTVAWLIADAASVLLLQQLALVGMIQVAVLTIAGWRVVRMLLFPLAYLLFSVPMGEFLVPHLQLVTADISVAALRLVGIPVFMDGLMIEIPTGRFEVAVTCSGVRFLIASIALGALFANLMYHSTARRAAFMVLAVVVPIIANGLRAFGIIVLAYLTNNELAVGVDHLVYGWIFFSLVLVMLFALGMTFREKHQPEETSTRKSAGTTGAVTSRGRLRGIAVAAVLVTTAGPGYATIQSLPELPANSNSTIVLPAEIGGWRMLAATRDTWQPHFPGADATLRRTYEKSGRRVHLYLAHFVGQRQGAELITQVNSISGNQHWRIVTSGGATVDMGGRPVGVRQWVLSGRGRQRVVWGWYRVGGGDTASALNVKLLEVRRRLRGQHLPGTAVAIGASFEDAPGEAAAALREFARELGAKRIGTGDTSK